jgi:hypothetical protein
VHQFDLLLDFEKKHRKEMEKQRLAHQHEMAIMQDERKGGGHISGVVQKLLFLH